MVTSVTWICDAVTNTTLTRSCLTSKGREQDEEKNKDQWVIWATPPGFRGWESQTEPRLTLQVESDRGLQGTGPDPCGWGGDH